jgi:hypothetical protein
MSIGELKEQLRLRKLSTLGTKSELKLRLENYITNPSDKQRQPQQLQRSTNKRPKTSATLDSIVADTHCAIDTWLTDTSDSNIGANRNRTNKKMTNTTTISRTYSRKQTNVAKE